MISYKKVINLRWNWLKSGLQRPQITDVLHLVAFCHIPLLEIAQGEHGGWKNAILRQGQKLWHLLLKKAGVQTVASAGTSKSTFSGRNDVFKMIIKLFHADPHLWNGRIFFDVCDRKIFKSDAILSE